MSRIYRLCLSAILFVSLVACGVMNQLVVPTETTVLPSNTSTVIPSTIPTDTPTETAVASATPTVSETPTSAIPIYLTLIPGISVTLTAAFSTPGAVNTLAVEQTMISATQGAQLIGFSGNLLKQCPNPSDAPMQNWLDIPVMPQATAGQVVQTLVGSYYCFRAPVTAADVESFYKEKLTSPNWMLQADSDGTMEFIGVSPAGFQILFLLYGPGNTNDLLVAINVTRPLSIPTTNP